MGASFVSISDKIRVWQGSIESYVVLENLIPKPRLLPKLNEFYLEPRLIFIGRLENQKCPEMFVQIQSKLDTPAVVIGDGRLRKDLEQFSVEKNLEIDFMGFQQDPWSFVQPKDYLLVTSKFEGKPLVILEALSLGIKIFARDIPELREEFKDFPIAFCTSVEDFVDKITQERRLLNSGSDKNKSPVFDLEKHNRQAINSWIQYLEKTLPNLD
jgi:glycosyltransferase involved in cell wall biosynthesis